MARSRYLLREVQNMKASRCQENNNILIRVKIRDHLWRVKKHGHLP